MMFRLSLVRELLDVIRKLHGTDAGNAREIAMLREENARLKASCDWLAQHCNELQVERTVLLNRVLEIQLPVFQIAREERRDPQPERGIPADLTPEALRAMATRYAPMPPAAGEAGTVYRPSAPELPREDALFEDMGDEAAARAGAGWSRDGELTFAK